MNPDSPIARSKDDNFNFSPLAKQLAPSLLLEPDQPSLVAGIEAPWGAGKTSFLNLIRQALKKRRSDIIILDYCPWIYSTIDSLILGFCVQLASQLKKGNSSNLSKIGNALIGFSKAVKPLRLIPGSEPFVTAAEIVTETAGSMFEAASTLNELDITNAKDKVQDALRSKGKPVVILVDDVDRLAPLEIRLLFQFIKAVADFDGVSYVVAYDPKPVEIALSFENSLDGKEYLKKFIQLPIRLPRLSRLSMKRFIVDRVTKFPTYSRFKLQDSEKKELIECATSNPFLQCIATPRDVIRCFNLFFLRLTDSRGEVLISELLKFVLLDLVCPEAIELVRSHSEFFIPRGLFHAEFETGIYSLTSSIWSDEKQINAERDRLCDMLPQKQLARSLLDSLFAPDKHALDVDVRAAASCHGLIKLLYGGTSPMAFSVKEALKFLKGGRRIDVIEEKVNIGVLREWLHFLSSLTEGATINAPIEIANLLIAKNASYVERDKNPYSISRQIGDYILELMARYKKVADAVTFIRSVINAPDGLFISGHVLLAVARDAGLWHEGKAYPLETPHPTAKKELLTSTEPSQILRLEHLWLERVREVATTKTLHKYRDVGWILHRWGQFSNNDYSEVQRYVEQFAAENDILVLFMKLGLTLEHSGFEKIFTAYDAILDSLARYDANPAERTIAINLVREMQNNDKTSNLVNSVQ